MNQTFNLKLATDNLSANANMLGTTIAQLQSVQVQVYAAFSEQQLYLTYTIRLPTQALAEQLYWPDWNSRCVSFRDYLWEQTCLECFITNDEKSYIEVNASPNGYYALYQFEDYRQPSTLPPSALLQKDSLNRACILWSNTEVDDKHSLHYQRRFSVLLDQLPYNLLSATTETLLHPCVILYLGGTALYFAPNHATPADFHQRVHWLAVDHH